MRLSWHFRHRPPGKCVHAGGLGSRTRGFALNFVKLFFAEEYQTENNWAFSVTKAGLEKQKQAALDAIKGREAEKQDEDSETDVMPRVRTGGGVTESGVVIAESSCIDDRRNMTVEDVERIAEIAASVHRQLIYNENVFNIVNEEALHILQGRRARTRSRR